MLMWGQGYYINSVAQCYTIFRLNDFKFNSIDSQAFIDQLISNVKVIETKIQRAKIYSLLFVFLFFAFCFFILHLRLRNLIEVYPLDGNDPAQAFNPTHGQS